MCFIFGTEFLKCLKYCKGGGGEVEEKTDSSTSRTPSINIFQIILFKMESATLKKSLLFSKTESTSKTESKIIFCMIAYMRYSHHGDFMIPSTCALHARAVNDTQSPTVQWGQVKIFRKKRSPALQRLQLGNKKRYCDVPKSKTDRHA